MPWDRGRLGVVWLDGRKTRPGGGHGSSAEMALLHTTLGSDGRLGEELVLDGRRYGSGSVGWIGRLRSKVLENPTRKAARVASWVSLT